MILYSLQGEHLNLHCGNEKCRPNNFMHYVVNGKIDTSDWKHLLEEFPDSLTKENLTVVPVITPDAPVVIPEPEENN
jgi:hypothetical protein